MAWLRKAEPVGLSRETGKSPAPIANFHSHMEIKYLSMSRISLEKCLLLKLVRRHLLNTERSFRHENVFYLKGFRESRIEMLKSDVVSCVVPWSH